MGLLHTNELPLKHVFTSLDDSTSGSDTFSVPLRKKLHGSVSNWLATNFKQPSVPLSSFPTPTLHALNDFSTDQFYAYEICCAVIHGKVDDDVMYEYLKVGPIIHSRWLILSAEYYVILCL